VLDRLRRETSVNATKNTTGVAKLWTCSTRRPEALKGQAAGQTRVGMSQALSCRRITAAIDPECVGDPRRCQELRTVSQASSGTLRTPSGIRMYF
jgi:hypothetical protein